MPRPISLRTTCAASVPAGVSVGLCTERSIEMIVGLLGILKAGGAYVPLHPEQPKARIAHQLSESKALVLLTQASLLDELPQFAGQIICLDRDHALWGALPESNPERMVARDDLAYVIYTSGSTGAPKGVAVRHRNLVNYSQFIVRRLRADEKAGLHFATVSTLSRPTWETATCVFPSLISGAPARHLARCRWMGAVSQSMPPAIPSTSSRSPRLISAP